MTTGGPDPTSAGARHRARLVVSAIEAPRTLFIPEEREVHCLGALAALARIRALLLSIVHLDEVGRHDVVGLDLRAMLEVWYFGLISLLGTPEDLERLEADHRFWRNRLSTKMQGITSDEGAEKTFPVSQRAVRAGELLLEVGEPTGATVDWYQNFYAAESLLSAHAGFTALKPYLTRHPEGGVGIVHDPPASDEARAMRIEMGALMATLLAKHTWARIGLDPSPFDKIGLGQDHWGSDPS
jgi:hypothetical protein